MCHGLVDLPADLFFQRIVDGRLRGHHLKIMSHIYPHRDPARFCFAYRVVRRWNSLPDSVVSAISVADFKTRLHDSGVLPDL